jgi:hypothetical protein
MGGTRPSRMSERARRSANPKRLVGHRAAAWSFTLGKPDREVHHRLHLLEPLRTRLVDRAIDWRRPNACWRAGGPARGLIPERSRNLTPRRGRRLPTGPFFPTGQSTLPNRGSELAPEGANIFGEEQCPLADFSRSSTSSRSLPTRTFALPSSSCSSSWATRPWPRCCSGGSSSCHATRDRLGSSSQVEWPRSGIMLERPNVKSEVEAIRGSVGRVQSAQTHPFADQSPRRPIRIGVPRREPSSGRECAVRHRRLDAHYRTPLHQCRGYHCGPAE